MIPLGRQRCEACDGVGRSPADPWITCPTCAGVGHHWRPGGPRFGAAHTLADASAGDIVELATGERGRVTSQVPRKDPITTFVALIDDFTEEEASAPTYGDSSVGVVSIAPRSGVLTSAKLDDDHVGEKDADVVDPLAARVRAGSGLL